MAHKPNKPLVYTFWNNKGGTGKTSLAFQVICAYANKYPEKKILVADLCPQANLSELLLGGLTGNGNQNLKKLQGLNNRNTIGGYIHKRLLSPFSSEGIQANDYISQPYNYNRLVPQNISLIAGDGLLDIQSTAMSNYAALPSPAVANPWAAVMNWLKDLIISANGDYDLVFIDTNPSFAIYTQIAIASSDRLLVPVMADDSSRRAFENLLSLIYGLNVPSMITPSTLFNNLLSSAGMSEPKIHLVLRNRITQYMGSASAYGSVLQSINQVVANTLKFSPQRFTSNSIATLCKDIRDFQTTGVVSFALGTPFFNLTPGYKTIMGQRTRVNQAYLSNNIVDIDAIVDAL